MAGGVTSIYVTVGLDKPLARLIVVRCLSVDKGQVLRFRILDTSFFLRVLPLKNGLTRELKVKKKSQPLWD